MAKKVVIETENPSKYKFPSPFGSHASMIDVKETIAKNNLQIDPSEFDFKKAPIVVCRDEYGVYETEPNRIDSGLADPNRWELLRRGISIESIKKDDTLKKK